MKTKTGNGLRLRDTNVMSLYISMRSASSEITDSPINKAITLLAATIAMNTKHEVIPDGPSIDVTFMLPGKYEKPGFNGMRMGGYSKENNTLFFERAVPEQIIFSEEASHFVDLVMEDVIQNAYVFFRENDIRFDIENWKQLLVALKQNHSNQQRVNQGKQGSQ